MTSHGIPLGRDQLLERLMQSLVGGDFNPGDKLPSERQLAETYNVSRPVIREVMQRLKERGILHIAPGSGAFLRESTPLDWARPLDALGSHRAATTRQLVEARVMLEVRAASLAAERATPEDLENLQRALAAFAGTTDLFERARCDIAFHSLIARSSHNPVIEMMFGAIAPLVFEVMLRSLSDSKVTERGEPFHALILGAIRAGDPGAASAAMDEHITLASTLFGTDFDAQLNTLAGRSDHVLFGSGVGLEEVIANVVG
ncbi:transcriptional regulator [Frondihabitans sucicola]|uniref:Transcriptional regulator n=1 Tax=Frondihabitans sucicola TaxID=1268041 RepID=A0ABM8GIG0_9MICO|nr:FadR/GntR family transcriptional regulator [Frondihabitans sucicola]BDZ48165.1 transcriptional regulator [Frondihabitans sucicola]